MAIFIWYGTIILIDDPCAHNCATELVLRLERKKTKKFPLQFASGTY